MFEIRVYDTIHDANLKKDWLFLQQGEDMTAFQQYNWNVMLEDEFSNNFLKRVAGEVKYVEVVQDNKPLIIAPLHIQKKSIKLGAYGYSKGVYILGMRGYSDYLNLIYTQLTLESLGFLIDKILEKTEAQSILFSQIRESTVMYRSLLQLCDSYYCEKVREEACVALDVPEVIDDFVLGISKNLKSNLKKQRNKYIRENFSIKYKLHQGSCDNEALAERLLQIHDQRYQEKNKKNVRVLISTLINKFKPTYDEIQYSLKNNENTWLLTGEFDGKVISYFYGLKDTHAVRIMQLGFDKEYTRFMPGNITLLKYIQENYSKLAGTVIDFTRGEERYKYELGGSKHMIFDYKVERK